MKREPGEESNGDPRWTGEVHLIESAMDAPLHWKKPRKIFVNSMSDLFHEKVTDEWIYKIFAIMRRCPHHTFQILTKRPERMRQYMISAHTGMKGVGVHAVTEAQGQIGKCCSNVWLGVSVEDQITADERIPLLLQTPAAVRWVSYEPALGPVDFTYLNHPNFIDAFGHSFGLPSLDWVVVGGESGPNARPMHPDWARAARDQCQAAGIPFFFKQWGEWLSVDNWPVDEDGRHYDTEYAPGRLYRGMDAHGMRFVRAGKKSAGRLLDSREWNEFPAVKR